MLTTLARSLRRSARGHRESMSCLPKGDRLLFCCLACSLARFPLARSTLVCFTILPHFQLSKHQEDLPFINFQRHGGLSLCKKGEGTILEMVIKLFLGSEHKIDRSGSKDEQCDAVTVDPKVEMIVSFLPYTFYFPNSFISFYIFM